ncbi:H-NS family nucleoid-associated regulatory protein [Roseateles sp.]|uniref:H-NS histone family protein n=1 Tax=Roseateles sp. TaxID=1971397 RepID=UPI003BAB3C27
MAKSLAKINEQIAKLQKEAHSIQSTVIARIKREIAQHGLTSEHLFGAASDSGDTSSTKRASKVTKTRATKTAGAAKPAKYADGQGNTWHGIGKRPQWIHDVLNAGQSLADFLVGAKKASPAAKKARVAAEVAPKAQKKRAVAKKTAAGKKAAKTTKAPAAAKAVKATKAASKAPAKKAARPAAAKKAPIKNTPKAKIAASPADATQTSN